MNQDLETVFIDECGYTGEDLLNREQPVFVLASVNLPESVCLEYKQEYFSRIRSQELKHSRLCRRNAQQDMIIQFIKDLGGRSDSVFFDYSHKKYMLATKLVDLIIEKLAYDSGIDFYEEGLNIAFSNLLYYMVPAALGEEYFDRFLMRFQKMCRLKTRKSFDDFFNMFNSLDWPNEVDDLFTFLKAAEQIYGYTILDMIGPNYLEVSGTCAFVIAGTWSHKLGDEFVIYHDNSENMLRIKKGWDKLTSPSVPSALVGQDRRTLQFPLKVKETLIEDSKYWVGLQLADILAGALTRFLCWLINGKNPEDTYARNLSNVLLDSFSGHAIWPQTKVTPEELGTVGAKEGDAIELS
jgi:hypothetical protein